MVLQRGRQDLPGGLRLAVDQDRDRRREAEARTAVARFLAASLPVRDDASDVDQAVGDRHRRARKTTEVGAKVENEAVGAPSADTFQGRVELGDCELGEERRLDDPTLIVARRRAA